MAACTYPGTPGGNAPATILLVEDDPLVAHALERILAGAGYAVVTCAHGTDALDTLAHPDTRIDAMVSDVGLPGTSGERLALAAAHFRPTLPVLLMTGFSETVTPETAGLFGVVAVLQKPITGRSLLAAVHGALRDANVECGPSAHGPAPLAM